MKLIFAGTPEFAGHILEAMLKTGLAPSLVLTQPDRPQGRGRRIVPSAVKALATAHGIPVLQPRTLSAKSEEGQTTIRQITSVDWDAMVVAAYGLMIPGALLIHPRHGAINVHASLLPRWRGAAPIEHSIMAGDATTGITLMQMDKGLDTGDIIRSAATSIYPDETGTSLTARLAEMGAQLLTSSLPEIGSLPRLPQQEEDATYAPKLTDATARIHWSTPTKHIHDQVRALTGRLTAWSTLPGSRANQLTKHQSNPGTGVRVRVLTGEPLASGLGSAPGEIINHDRNDLIAVATADGAFGIASLQLSIGKGTPLDARSARNGFRELFARGTRFSAGDEPPQGFRSAL